MTVSPVRSLFLRSLTVLSLCLALPGFSALTNFYTGFESAEAFTNGLALDGQGGWSGLMYSPSLTFTNSGASGNGVAAGGLGGSAQAAYVGLTPLPSPYTKFVELSHPLSLDPNGSGLPIVAFTAKIKIVDTVSPSGPWDDFYIDFYNQDDVRIFGIDFDNFDLKIWHELKSGSTNIVTFLSPLTNSVEYDLSIMMNFASNRCTVALNGMLPATNTFPIAAPGFALNLDTLSALWLVANPGTPGNNYMLFDTLRVTSAPLAPARPTLTLLKAGGTNSAASVRLSGDDGYRFALDSSTNMTAWQAIGTNLILGGTVNYTDPSATNKLARYYRARWVP